MQPQARRPVVLFSAPPGDWPAYAPRILRAADARGLSIDLVQQADPASVEYVVYAPQARAPVDFAAFPHLRAVLSLWAGVERIVGDPTLTVPLARMVDPGLTEGMRDYVVGHVLRYHLDLDAHLAAQDGVWRAHAGAPLARERTVGVLGLGALGLACADALARLGFRTLGWSRVPKPRHPGIETHAGPGGLDVVLARSEILVLLLPSTPATEGLLDAARLARLPRGARLINPGRGSLIDDAALLAALDAGHIAHATLDVFREEPLPPAHPYWAHPRVTVTPHVAAATRPSTSAEVIAENLARAEAGMPLLHLVDRALGY
jgi:glyoxylate/hydroxypyruvate reductase A